VQRTKGISGKGTTVPDFQERNKHLQAILIEAAKIANLWNPQLAAVHEREMKKGKRNLATLAVTQIPM
jgi:hypothetical protein